MAARRSSPPRRRRSSGPARRRRSSGPITHAADAGAVALAIAPVVRAAVQTKNLDETVRAARYYTMDPTGRKAFLMPALGLAVAGRIVRRLGIARGLGFRWGRRRVRV